MGKGRKTKGGMKKQLASQKKMAARQMQAQQDIPVNKAPSNDTWDKLGNVLFFGLLIVGFAVLCLGIYFSSVHFTKAVTQNPIDWWNCVMMTLLLALSLFVARSCLWLSFFGTVMLGSKMGAWSVAESVSKRAIKFRRLVPNGSGWASMALVQSLVSRGQFSDAIKYADEEWARSGEDDRQVLNLGPMCVAVGMAHQVDGNLKETSRWNDRAIESLTKMLDQANNPKKGLFGAAAKMQAEQWSGQVKMQLAAAHFNNASVHFNAQDYRRAKENFKKAVDFASDAPDFPQKSDIIKMGRDQLARLKHT